MRRSFIVFSLSAFSLLAQGCKSSMSGAKAGNQQADATLQRPRNIILMIGDGMGLAQISAAYFYNDSKLNMLHRSTAKGYHSSQSANDFITDSAAGATAFSTGKRTYNGAIGVGTDSLPLKTILELAEDKGLSTGLVATSSLTHATPASFAAHQPSRKLDSLIARDILKHDIEVLLGGGRPYLRRDSLEARGYQVVIGTQSIANATDSGKLAGFFNTELHPPAWNAGRWNFLEMAAQKACNILDNNPRGYFLMIEGSQIDWGGHDNNSQQIVYETMDFDRTVGHMFDRAIADKETLVIITADHETGGYSLNGWDSTAWMPKPAFTTKEHTGILIPVFAFGPGSELFNGIYRNTDIFDKMKFLLGL